MTSNLLDSFLASTSILIFLNFTEKYNKFHKEIQTIPPRNPKKSGRNPKISGRNPNKSLVEWQVTSWTPSWPPLPLCYLNRWSFPSKFQFFSFFLQTAADLSFFHDKQKKFSWSRSYDFTIFLVLVDVWFGLLHPGILGAKKKMENIKLEFLFLPSTTVLWNNCFPKQGVYLADFWSNWKGQNKFDDKTFRYLYWKRKTYPDN